MSATVAGEVRAGPVPVRGRFRRLLEHLKAVLIFNLVSLPSGYCLSRAGGLDQPMAIS